MRRPHLPVSPATDMLHTSSMAEDIDDLDRLMADQAKEDPDIYDRVDGLVQVRRIVHALVEARERAGLTQSELAKRMGTTRQTLNRIETFRQNPGLASIAVWAALVGYDLELRKRPKGQQIPGAIKGVVILEKVNLTMDGGPEVMSEVARRSKKGAAR